MKLTGRFEGIFVMPNLCTVGHWIAQNSDHIKARRILSQPMPFKKSDPGFRQMHLFGHVDGFGWISRIVGAARFDFDKYDRVEIDGDEIYFTKFVFISSKQNDVPKLQKIAFCRQFAAIS